MIQAFSATSSCSRLFRLYAFFLVCPQLSCCNPTLVLQALPTNRQLLEIEALLCCNPAFGLQALPTTGALLYYSEKKTVAIPHSGCRLFRPWPSRRTRPTCIVAIPHSGCRLFRREPQCMDQK